MNAGPRWLHRRLHRRLAGHLYFCLVGLDTGSQRGGCLGRWQDIQRSPWDMMAGYRQVAKGAVDLDLTGVAFERLSDLATPDQPQPCTRRRDLGVRFEKLDNLLSPVLKLTRCRITAFVQIGSG